MNYLSNWRLPVAVLVLIMIIAFRLHTLLGWGLIIVMAGGMVYASRSSYYTIRGSSALTGRPVRAGACLVPESICQQAVPGEASDRLRLFANEDR